MIMSITWESVRATRARGGAVSDYRFSTVRYCTSTRSGLFVDDLREDDMILCVHDE